MADLSTEIKIGVDASGVEAGVGKAKRSLNDLGAAANKIGQDGGKGMNALGAGAGAASQKVDAATKSMIGSVQRLSAQMDAGEKNSRKYFETLAAQRNVNLDALRPYLDQLDAVRAKTGAATEEATKFTAAARSIGTALAAIGVAAGAGFATSFIKNVVDLGDRLDDLAEKSGISARELSVLRYAGEVSGTSFDSMAVGLRKLAQNMAAAGGGAKEQSAVFEALGVKVKALDGSLRGSGEVLGDLATKFASFRDGPEKAALAMELFGKSGEDMIPLLNKGREGIEALRTEAEKLGAVIGGDFSAASAAFNDNLKRLALSSEGARVTLVGELLPTLNEIAEAFIRAKDGGSSFSVLLGSGLRNTLQAVTVLAANLQFVFGGVGREIGAIAAQTVALARLDIAGFRAIGDAVKADADRARKELDDLERRILGLGTLMSEGRRGLSDPRVLGTVGSIDEQTRGWRPSAPIVNRAGAGTGSSARDKDLERETRLLAELSGVTASYIEDLQALDRIRTKGLVTEERYIEAVIALIAKQPGAKKAMEDMAKVEEQRVKALNDLREVELKRVADIEKAVDGIAKQNETMRDEIAMLGLSKKEQADYLIAKNDTVIAIKEEQLARMANKEIMSREAIALEEEISRLKERNGLLRTRQGKEAAIEAADEMTKAAQKTREAWERESERIADSFVDNLMKGGKSVAEYLKDLFRTLVLRPILQPVGNLVGGLANQAVSAGANALGIGNAVGAGSALMGTNAALGFANVTGAGLDGFLAASGGFGTMSTGASLTGVLGAIPGWGWAAMAAAAVAGLIASGGETRVGGQYSNGSLLGAPSGGQIDGAGVAIDATLKSINSLLSGLGSSAQVRQLLSGLEQSEKGKGFAYAGGFLTSGEAFGQTADGFMNRRGDKTKEQALAEFGEELKQATLQALQAADVPGQVGEYLKQLGDIDQLSGGSLDEALGYLQTYMGLQEQLLSLQSTETENLTRARQKELDALPESLRAIAEQIHAEQDLAKVRQEEAAKGQQIANERLGLARQYYQLVGDTQALRALELEGLDASNRFIQERIYAIQDEQAAQVAAQQAIEKAAQSARQAQEDYARSLEDAQDFLGGVTRNIGQYLDSLRSGPAGLLSPRDQLANAKSQFERQLGLAQGGDRDALSSITQYADAFITAQKGFSASGGDTKAVIALVQQTLAALPNQVRAEDLIVAAIKDAAKTTTQAIAGAALSDAENQRLTREALNTPLVEMARKLDAGFSTLDTTLDQKLDFSEFRAGFAGAASEATLKSVFDAIDSNADGFIQRQEATTTAVAKMEAVLASALDSGFSVLDRNADSQITRDEFLTGLAGLATDDVLNQGFDRLDVNGDKIVDRQEATTAAVQSLRAIIDSRLANGFTGLDRSLDGLLDFNEFRTGFVGLASDATLQRIFGEIDENGSGTISALEANVVAVRELQSKVVASLTTGFDELAGQDNQVSRDEFLRAFAGLATDSTLRQLFTGLDTDQDGQISKLEAIRAQTEATASYTGSQKLTGEQMLARLNQDSILSFSRAQMIDFTVYTANGAQRAAAATEGLLALAQSAGLKMQFRRDTVTSGWYATGAAFHGTTITRPTHIAGLGEAGPETILPLANVGGVMGVRATGADSKEVVAAIDRLDARLAAIESNTADGDITINLKNVTVDERVLIEKVIKTTRERAARGEGALA